MAVDLGQLLAEVVFGLLDEVSHGGDFLSGPLGSGFDGVEEVDDPLFPVFVFGDASEEVLALVSIGSTYKDNMSKK